MTFQANYKGIGEMLCAPWMVADMHRRAELVAGRCRLTAPRHSGHYAASFQVTSGIRTHPSKRAFGRVTNTADYSFQVEVGTEDTPAHRTMSRALEAAKG